MKTKHKNFIKFNASLFLLFIQMAVWHLFLTAYFNPSKSVQVFINNYNEAFVECWVLMPILFILGLFALILNYKECVK
jgi:ABC-type Na+ efflux pump permease subunit